jgi:hypothetical protein
LLRVERHLGLEMNIAVEEPTAAVEELTAAVEEPNTAAVEEPNTAAEEPIRRHSVRPGRRSGRSCSFEGESSEPGARLRPQEWFQSWLAQ